MEQLLFLDACMRGPEVSRTARLCRRFLEEYRVLRPETRIVRRDLTGTGLPVEHSRSFRFEDWLIPEDRGVPVMTAALAQERDALARAGSDSPLLAPAREVAGSDLILVGAPYWDLSFPAALKVCLEWASCLGITFRYTAEGEQVGMSRARCLVYVTTGGGPVWAQNLGYDYLRGWAAMMGIGRTLCLAAEDLDVWGTDVEGALARAEEEIPALVRQAADA